MRLTAEELKTRIKKLIGELNKNNPEWDSAVIIGRVNQYYFTGTIQDAVLIIKRNGDFFYFARKSFERARDESPLKEFISPINTYRDAAVLAGEKLGNCCFEDETVPYGVIVRLQKYFKIDKLIGIDALLRSVRAVKSLYEIHCLEESGKRHEELLTSVVPSLMEEGISEAEFAALVYYNMIKLGHHGVSRFFSYQTELFAGQFGFSENTLYPTSFNGPAGSKGMSAAAPVLGSRQRKLRKGDLVFVDVSFGIEGYHTDKTQVYIFKGKADKELVKAHSFCLEILSSLEKKLIPGAIPSKIYEETLSSLPESEKENFMGYKNSAVKFLGHGTGLTVDEFPIIAKGFDAPVLENMVISLEPKKAVEKLGLAGVEETYIVTQSGLKVLTGGAKEIILVN